MLMDLAALRTFVAAVDLQGFGKAAQRLHRSPGAVSLQMRALEQRVGKPLFHKQGRRQVLTEAGELLLGYSRRLLEINDEAFLALRGAGMEGRVRFGMVQDVADSWLPQALGRFDRAHPGIRVDLRVDRSAHLAAQVEAGELDLALVFGPVDAADGKALARLPVRWFAHPDLAMVALDAVPLLVLDSPCGFRDAAVAALDAAGRPWRVALSSGSVSALWAAAEAGLGVVARTALHVPGGLRCIDGLFGLPALPDTGMRLLGDPLGGHPLVAHLAGVIGEVVGDRLEA